VKGPARDVRMVLADALAHARTTTVTSNPLRTAPHPVRLPVWIQLAPRAFTTRVSWNPSNVCFCTSHDIAGAIISRTLSACVAPWRSLSTTTNPSEPKVRKRVHIDFVNLNVVVLVVVLIFLWNGWLLCYYVGLSWVMFLTVFSLTANSIEASVRRRARFSIVKFLS
jgi:hypothetical protein